MIELSEDKPRSIISAYSSNLTVMNAVVDGITETIADRGGGNEVASELPAGEGVMDLSLRELVMSSCKAVTGKYALNADDARSTGMRGFMRAYEADLASIGSYVRSAHTTAELITVNAIDEMNPVLL